MNILEERNKNTHKGDYGRVLIIAGSTNMAGAAILASRACLRTGTGLCYSYVPRDIFQAIQISTPEVICFDRKENIDFSIFDSILFGPGMGVSVENRDLLISVLQNTTCPMVIDADGLNIISKYDLFNLLRDNIVLTPHKKEMERLIGVSILDREEQVEKLLEKIDATILLKGNNTIVRNKENEYVNNTGNPGMATAGSGDTLSGIIASLLGRKMDTFTSAKLGAYIHGLAGDLAKDDLGEEGMIASDIIEKIPYAIKKIKIKSLSI